MPRKPEVHFRLKPSDKTGKRLIYLDFAYSGHRLKYSFGQFVDPKDWNDKKELVKNKEATTANNKFRLNELLAKLKGICESGIVGVIPAPETLRAQMDAYINQNDNDIKESGPSLYKLADRFISGEIKFRGKDKSKSSLQNYAAVLKHIKDFEIKESYPIDFDTINLDFFYKYVDYLTKQNLAVNTIAKDISIIKVFMGEAVDMEYTDNIKFRHKKFSYNEVETDQVYLSEAELTSLYQFDLSANKKLEQVRDLFIFGAWVGLRFSDYSTIKPENIIDVDGDQYIKIITQKTKDLVYIPCNPVVLDIFNKYSSNSNKLPKTISNQKFNEYIKDVCKLAGMDETGRLSTSPKVQLYEAISSHTCRRSFASNYYLQGFPTIDLMKITGHKTERAFLKYIRVSKLDAAKRLSAHMKVMERNKMNLLRAV
ncbi:MAG: site-specific integrase [Bacteroidia bacterium]|nr:site-specific integrase [Bacteroidia bacterium]